MKLFKKISLFILLSCTACDVLDVTPPNVLGEKTVFSSVTSVEAYFANLYSYLLIEDFKISSEAYTTESTKYRFEYYTGYGVACPSEDFIDKNEEGIDGGIGYLWFNYKAVREVNDFFGLIDKYSANFTEAQVNNWKAEAHALRAWYYFTMVKRYGGVPLITVPQDIVGTDKKTLYVSRSSEKECWDFILEELQKALDLKITATPVDGKIGESAVLFLRAQAALYAASIAKYNTPVAGIGNYKDPSTGKQVCGIPASEAANYYSIAYKAAADLIESGHHALARGLDSNGSDNFAKMFISPESHTEDIFVKYYKKPDLGHRWDYYHLPLPYGIGSRFDNPTLELINMYDHLDGTSAEITVNNNEFLPDTYPTASALFENRDYRLGGTVYYPGAPFAGGTFDIRRGVYVDGKLKTGTGTVEVNNKKYNIRGMYGMGQQNETSTGFLCRKYINEPSISGVNYSNLSDHAWIVMRYAEVLLIAAECAAETGSAEMQSLGLKSINDVRTRAGLPEISSLNVEEVRKQWVCEFAFENSILWQKRRWRTLSETLTGGFVCHGLEPYWDITNNVWKFKKITATKYPKISFTNRYYYNWINTEDISSNPKIIQNFGY